MFLLGTSLLLGIYLSPKQNQFDLFRTLGAVLGATLHASLDTDGVKRTAHDVIAHARKVFDPAATDKDNRVFLKVVADSGDIRGNLDPVGQAYPGDLAQRRVRLFRCRRIDPRADTAFLRTALKCRRSRFVSLVFPAHTDELIDCWHSRF